MRADQLETKGFPFGFISFSVLSPAADFLSNFFALPFVERIRRRDPTEEEKIFLFFYGDFISRVFSVSYQRRTSDSSLISSETEEIFG